MERWPKGRRLKEDSVCYGRVPLGCLGCCPGLSDIPSLEKRMNWSWDTGFEPGFHPNISIATFKVIKFIVNDNVALESRGRKKETQLFERCLKRWEKKENQHSNAIKDDWMLTPLQPSLMQLHYMPVDACPYEVCLKKRLQRSKHNCIVIVFVFQGALMSCWNDYLAWFELKRIYSS